MIIPFHKKYLDRNKKIKTLNIKVTPNDPSYQFYRDFVGTSSMMMFNEMTEDEIDETSSSSTKTSFFDPKIFIESLFKTRQAEIQVILNGTTAANFTTTTFTNLSSEDDVDVANTNDDDSDKRQVDYTPDVYFLIGAVSFIIFVILCLAMYKGIIILKTSLRDSFDDTVPVPGGVDLERQQQPHQNSQQQRPELVQSVASGYLFNGTCCYCCSTEIAESNPYISPFHSAINF